MSGIICPACALWESRQIPDCAAERGGSPHAHPMVRWGRPGQSAGSPPWLNKVLGVQLGCGDLIKSVPFDAIECTNAVPGSGVKYNIAAIDAMRKQHVSVAVTGGSDAPSARFVGKGKTYYGGNEGILSLYHSLLLGFTRGAEGYWRTREKVHYYARLIMAIVRNAVQKKGSIN